MTIIRAIWVAVVEMMTKTLIIILIDVNIDNFYFLMVAKLNLQIRKGL
jgi:hypothetical protein